MLKKIFSIFQNQHGTTSSFTDKKILVIEDTAVDREYLVRILEKKGFHVRAVDNGKKGLDAVQDDPPDLICLDCGLPDMKGPDVCRSLKNDEMYKNIPVIFLTGKDSPNYVVDCFDVGAEYYLTKPFDSRTILNQIDIIFQDQSAFQNRKK